MGSNNLCHSSITRLNNHRIIQLIGETIRYRRQRWDLFIRKELEAITKIEEKVMDLFSTWDQFLQMMRDNELTDFEQKKNQLNRCYQDLESIGSMKKAEILCYLNSTI